MRRIPPAERPRGVHHAEVEGRRGDFPFDMLRYDGAFPTRGEDAFKLYPERPTPSRCVSCKEGQREIIKVHLSSYTGFTPDRWLSFGWTCKEVD